MKQFNFSNVIAIVAILLCFFAFTTDKKTISKTTISEKEYCVLRVDYYGGMILRAYSNGTSDKFKIKELQVDPKDNSVNANLPVTVKLLTDMKKDGWEVKSNSITGTAVGAIIDQYFLER